MVLLTAMKNAAKSRLVIPSGLTFNDDMISVEALAQFETSLKLSGGLMHSATENQIAEVLLMFVLLCRDNGSSGKADFQGSHKVGAFTVHFNELAAHIRNITTVRKFCARFATLMFNWGIENQSPPAKWAKFRFTDDTKWVGFDFAYGINRDGSISSRPLTNRELAAIDANRQVAVYRAREEATTISTASEFNQGIMRTQPETVNNTPAGIQ